jgi:hypothetical protein
MRIHRKGGRRVEGGYKRWMTMMKINIRHRNQKTNVKSIAFRKGGGSMY